MIQVASQKTIANAMAWTRNEARKFSGRVRYRPWLSLRSPGKTDVGVLAVMVAPS